MPSRTCAPQKSFRADVCGVRCRGWGVGVVRSVRGRGGLASCAVECRRDGHHSVNKKGKRKAAATTTSSVTTCTSATITATAKATHNKREDVGGGQCDP